MAVASTPGAMRLFNVVAVLLLGAACTAEVDEIPIPTDAKADRADLTVALSSSPIAFGFDCAEDCGVSVSITTPGAAADLGTLRVEATDGTKSFPIVLSDGKVTLPNMLLNRGGEAGHVRLVLEKSDSAPDTTVTLGVRSQGRIGFVDGAWPHLVTDDSSLRPYTDPFPLHLHSSELNGDGFFEVSAVEQPGAYIGFTMNSPLTMPRAERFTWRWFGITKRIDTGIVDAMVTDYDCSPSVDVPGGHSCLVTNQVKSDACTVDYERPVADLEQVAGSITCPAELRLAQPTFHFRTWVRPAR